MNKVMKAPEKIYMTPSFGEPDNVLLASFSKSHLNYHRDIEYTRTDVIEKKIEDWFADVENGTVITDVKLFSKDLIEYLKK